MGGDKPYYTDENIKNMKKVLDSRNGGSNFTLYFFLKLSDTPYMVSKNVPKITMDFEYDGKSKPCQQDREYIRQKSDQILSENFKDLSVSEKENVFKMCTEMVRKDIWEKIFS